MQAAWNWELFWKNSISAFRRKAQVRSNQLFIFIKSVPNAKETPPGGSINQRLIKLKPGQKTAFPFPLMVSPWLCKRQALISSLHPYSLPFFIPLHFACCRRPNPIHLFVPFSIAMFSGLGFNPFFYLLFFGLFGGNFIRVSFFLCYRILRVTSNICC